jgi:hypothetical protein
LLFNKKEEIEMRSFEIHIHGMPSSSGSIVDETFKKDLNNELIQAVRRCPLYLDEFTDEFEELPSAEINYSRESINIEVMSKTKHGKMKFTIIINNNITEKEKLQFDKGLKESFSRFIEKFGINVSLIEIIFLC